MRRICPKCKTLTDEALCPADGFQTVVYRSKPADNGDPLLGKIFEERYTIDSVIGRGGFGAVYRATQLAIGRTVAIKVLKAHLADDLKEIARFQQEARAIAALKHPNIVEIYDFGQTAEGSLYLVMDFLEGEPLDSILKAERRLGIPRAKSIAIQALDALAEAHAQKIVHRDLKPENLFIAKEGRRRDVVKLLDFGIAKVSGDVAAEMTLTQAGMAIGSPKFMSPEQCRGKRVTAQSDLYSFGCILYRMLFGRQVFEEDAPSGYLIAHTTQQPELPVVDGRRPSGPLVDLVFQCLAKRPEDRPASAEALAAALDAMGPEDIRWEPISETAAVPEGFDGTVKMPAGSAAPPISDSVTVARAPIDTDATIALATGLSAPTDDASAGDPPTRKRPFALWAAAVLLIGGGAAAAIIATSGGGPTDTVATPGDPAPMQVVAEAPAPAAEPPETPAAVEVRGTPGPAATNAAGDEAATTEEPVADAKPIADDEPAARVAEEPAALGPVADEAAAVRRFEVEVASTPAKAQVWRAGERLGETPMKISWAEGEEAPVLELRHAGYRRAKVVLAEADDGKTHTKRLRKSGATPAAKPDEPKSQEPEKW